MEWFETLLLGKVAIFALVLARVGSLVATAPLLQIAAIPNRVKALLAVTLALLVTPLQPMAGYTSPWNVVTFANLLFNEVLVGLLLGLGMQVLLSGIQVTGQLVSQLSGMQLAEISSPTFDDGSNVFAELIQYSTLALFVVLGGHRLVVGALLETFEWAPPGHALYGESFTDVMIGLLGQSFQLGIRAAAPMMIALLLATLVLGLISRTLPQINVIAVGFGLNSLLTIGGLLFCLGTVMWTFQDPIVGAVDSLVEAVAATAAD
jgi:flagellar biosynthetic protein FliR